jgi:beta-N-acetylglucosaminidase
MEVPNLRNIIIKAQKFENANFLTVYLQKCKPLYYCRLRGNLTYNRYASDVGWPNDRNNHAPIKNTFKEKKVKFTL